MPELLIIVNPRSASGSTGRRWGKIERTLRWRLGALNVAMTEYPGHATAIARQATGQYDTIIALGGDGTLNEVVNGLIVDDRPIRSDLTLGIIPRGTGADFVRTLGIPSDLAAAADRVAAGAVQEVDVGKVRYRRPDGSEAVRYFINEAEIGMGAAACEQVNRSPKILSGSLTYMWGIMITSLRYRSQPVALSLDGGPVQHGLLTNVWIANGAYSGSGICNAPRARLDDGLLDIVEVSQMNLLEKISRLPRLRSGAFVDLPKVTYRTARRVEAESETLVPIETDGEPIGTLPATFELIGERLKVIA